jgi:TolB-like protein
MPAVETIEIQNELNRESIRLQLKKILEDPLFARSHILQRFLQFIVEETLNDRTNCLKEYTIGVKVLNKPSSFNPQSTSIVRIHAVRLRKALDNYYINRGVNDQVRITLPAGHYFPVFIKIDTAKAKVSRRKENLVPAVHPTMTVAVMPFYISHENDQMKQFTDGLGALLANALMESGTASVISYFSTRRMAEQYIDIREIAKRVSARYLFTGDVQVLKGNIRISVQLVKAETGFLEWFQALESKYSPERFFNLQHLLIQKLMSSVVDKTSAMLESENRKSMVAVA